MAEGSSSEPSGICLLWPNSVFVCMSVCVGNMQWYCRKQKTKQAVVFGWPATKQEEDCDETKQKRYNQAKLESEVRTKERTNVFRFSVFCRLRRKKGVLSLSLFSPVVAPSQKRATSFLCDSCERPSRTPVLLLACNLSIVCLSSMLPVTWLPLFST